MDGLHQEIARLKDKIIEKQGKYDKAQRGLTYCMSKLGGVLSEGEWKYLERLIK